MPPKKRTAPEAFEFHKGLVQLDTVCGRVARHLDHNRRDLRTIDPVQALTMADELDGIAKMFRAHAGTYNDITQTSDAPPATLMSLRGDALALVYDALGTDDNSKRALRQTCRDIFEDLAMRRPFRVLRYIKENKLRIFADSIRQLSCATSIRELSISWTAACRICETVGFERFTALEQVMLFSTREVAVHFKPITQQQLIGEHALAPVSVLFKFPVDVQVSQCQLQSLFRRRVSAVTGYTPLAFRPEVNYPLKTLHLTGGTAQSLCNAAAYVTEAVHIVSSVRALDTYIVKKPIATACRPKLYICVSALYLASYSDLINHYSSIEVTEVVLAVHLKCAKLWKSGKYFDPDFL